MILRKLQWPPLEVLEEPSGCSVDWGLWWLQITSPSLGYNDKTCRVFLLMKQTCGCETACKVKFVIPPKGILWSHLGSTVASSCCLRQLMFPQAPPSQSWGWWIVRVKKPTGDYLPCALWLRDAPSWRTKLGSWAGAEAGGRHGGCMALCAQGWWCQHKHPHRSAFSLTDWAMRAQQVAEPGYGLH